MAVAQRKKFGEILVEAGVIKEVALRQALERQRITGWRLGKVLETMGVIAEKDIAVVLSRQHGFRSARDLARHAYPPEILALVAAAQARKYQVFPLKREGNSLLLAMVNPLDIPAIDAIAATARLHVVPVVTTSKEIEEAIRRHYDGRTGDGKAMMTIGTEVVTLLVVDAVPASRIRTVDFLKALGCRVEHAASDAEALNLATKLSPHLVLVDTEYPDQVNPQALLHALPDTALIAVGPNPVREEVAFLDAGFVDFIHKPVHQERFAARIRRTLQLLYGERKRCRPSAPPSA